MTLYTQEAQEEALGVITTLIGRCVKTQPQFEPGTSQAALLKNRIQALRISQALLRQDNDGDTFSSSELRDALPPLLSIRRKCEKAQGKFSAGTGYYSRLEGIIQAMRLSESLIEAVIRKKGEPSHE